MKPFPFHFKLFSLNDAFNGYQKCFYLYRGKAEQRPDGISATAWPVHKLFTRKTEHQNKNHILTTDNWYTSIDVALSAAATGNHFIGTIKVNKQGLPDAGKFAKKGAGKKQRGVMKQMSATIRNIPLFVTAWMDRKPVHILSTICSGVANCTRQVKTQVGATDTWTRQTFPIPGVIKVYNKYMGGTDGFDWRIALNRPKIVTKSWIPKVLCHFVNASMVNSYLIYKWHFGKPELGILNPQRFPLSEFVELIMVELAEEFRQSKVLTAGAMSRDNRTKSSWNKDRSRLVGAHFPIMELKDDEDRDSADNKFSRRRCMMCQRKVSNLCEQCGVALCLDAPSNGTNCWKQFHTERDIMRCRRHDAV
jgi:hypothetical protein